MSLSKSSWRITLALSSTLRAYAPRFCAVMLTVSRVLSEQLHHRIVSPDPCWDGSGVRLSPPHHTCGSLHNHPTHRQPVRQSLNPLSTTRPEERRASATSWTPSRSISKSHRSRRPGKAEQQQVDSETPPEVFQKRRGVESAHCQGPRSLPATPDHHTVTHTQLRTGKYPTEHHHASQQRPAVVHRCAEDREG